MGASLLGGFEDPPLDPPPPPPPQALSSVATRRAVTAGDLGKTRWGTALKSLTLRAIEWLTNQRSYRHRGWLHVRERTDDQILIQREY